MTLTLRSVRYFLPEIALCAVALFFTFRELGTFPAAWEDSGLYTMVAKSIASGHGYTLPILHSRWAFPYFLSVGPTVILPVALFIKLFGFSLSIARIAPALYLLGTCLAFYFYVRRIAGTNDARWSTALLITLSAFINGGKPVLGSVPAFFFLLLGLHLLHGDRPSVWSALQKGVVFGLAILTKITFILILPSLCVAMLCKDIRRQRRTMFLLLLTVTVASLLFLPWLLLELSYQSGFMTFVHEVLTRPADGSVVTALAQKILFLLRFQYQYFCVLFVLACAGFFHRSLRLSPRERVFLVSLFLLFLLHFLVREGWYRHLLPAHLLLLPFVPAGARRLLRGNWWAILLIFVVIQIVWQLDHRGSSRSTASQETVAYIQEHLSDTDVLIQHPEIFVQLPENPHWFYFPLPGNRELMPAHFVERSPDDLCMLRVRKPYENDEEQYGDTLIQIGGKYLLIPPRADCVNNKK